MKRNNRKNTFIQICAVMLLPLGCGGQPQEIELNLRVDETPLEREEVSAVNSYASVLRQVQPAVVSVYSQRMVEEGRLRDHPALQRFFGEEDGSSRERMQGGVGSGVIISAEGYVLTNNHVIEGADRIIVQFADDGRMEAEVVGSDAPTDIAVLRLNGAEGQKYPFAVLANSDLIEVGDVVFALGNALGIGHAVTSGIISARGRTSIGILGERGYEDFFQTDASMNIGNSGGPLVDSLGRVVGINTAIASPGGGNVGIGFAIPINMARDVMFNLVEFGEVRRGYLGVSLRDPHPGLPVEFGAPGREDDLSPGVDEGAMVIDVVDGSPAAEAGLREGDVIVELDGEKVGSASGLRLEVAKKQPGSTVELGIVRDGERIDQTVTLGSLDEAEQARREMPAAGESDELLPGVMVAPVTTELRQQLRLPEDMNGLVVTEVAENSVYAAALPSGAVIVQVNRQSVTDVETARERIRTGRNLFLMFHEGALHHVVVEVGRR